MIETADKAFLSNHIVSYDFEFTDTLYNFDYKLGSVIKYFNLFKNLDNTMVTAFGFFITYGTITHISC